MENSERRPEKIIAAAEKAISKITDPAVKAKAIAQLKDIQKKLTVSQRRSRTSRAPKSRIRDRDVDFDR